MNHSLKSADGGTHIKILAVSLAASSIWIFALSAIRLKNFGVSEIVARPAISAVAKAPAVVQMADVSIFIGWSDDFQRTDTAAITQER